NPIRTALPALLEKHKLLTARPGTKKLDDAAIERLARVIYKDPRDKAAESVAAMLAEGVDPDCIREAIAVAATMLVLGDPGRPKEWASAIKPVGSVHGDSVGVHASDAANAWRHIARVSNTRNTAASLIVGAFHTAGQSGGQGPQTYQLAEQLEKIEAKDAPALLRELDAAVKGKE